MSSLISAEKCFKCFSDTRLWHHTAASPLAAAVGYCGPWRYAYIVYYFIYYARHKFINSINSIRWWDLSIRMWINNQLYVNYYYYRLLLVYIFEFITLLMTCLGYCAGIIFITRYIKLIWEEHTYFVSVILTGILSHCLQYYKIITFNDCYNTSMHLLCLYIEVILEC